MYPHQSRGIPPSYVYPVSHQIPVSDPYSRGVQNQVYINQPPYIIPSEIPQYQYSNQVYTNQIPPPHIIRQENHPQNIIYEQSHKQIYETLPPQQNLNYYQSSRENINQNVIYTQQPQTQTVFIQQPVIKTEYIQQPVIKTDLFVERPLKRSRSVLLETNNVFFEQPVRQSFLVAEPLPKQTIIETTEFIRTSNLNENEKKIYEDKFIALEKQLHIVRQQSDYYRKKFEDLEKKPTKENVKKGGFDNDKEKQELTQVLLLKNKECEEWKVIIIIYNFF